MESSQPLGIRGVLGITAFRRLWIALSLSSLGDWLGLLAQSALAKTIAGNGYAQQSYAVAGVFALRLIPAILFGPIAGVVADRLDRRWTMVTGDSVRCLLFVSIPIVHTLWWLFAATFLIEVAAMFWIPAKEATVPNLVPRGALESANQVSLLTAYGTAPIAAGIFTVLALITKVLGRHFAFFTGNPVNLALYFDAATFLFSALTIARLTGIPRGPALQRAAAKGRDVAAEGQPLRTLLEGWRYIGENRKIRGLIIGIVGAFAAGGAVIGLANTYVGDLGGGQAGYGLLFGAVFLGLAGGMFSGPRVLSGISRERLFGAVIVGAGLTVCVFAVFPNLVFTTLCALVVGFFGGTAWITGQTMLGQDVADELRGRTFAFVQSLIRITLVLILAVAPAIAGTIGRKRLSLPGHVSVTYGGAAITLFAAGLVAAGVGWVAYSMMDDVPGKTLRTEIKNALHRSSPPPRPSDVEPEGAVTLPVNAGADGDYPGYFLCFEGGDGSGKSTQLSVVADWLRGKGHEVVTTREPGGTLLGGKLREIVLDARHADAISPRAEALIYAADRADHVERIIRPALERGAIVVTDRYVDSSLAYQGAGRALPTSEVALLSGWATLGLKPDMTVLLDLDPIAAARRRTGPADRLEAESLDFHGRVRERYLELAAAEPARYLVVDASEPVAEITGRIKAHLEPRLPTSARESAAERKRRETEAAEAARLEAVRQAERTAEERRLAQIESERQEKARAEELKRTAAARAERETLEEDARRIEREAGERAREAAARDLADNIAQADAAGATPEEVAAAAEASAAATAAAVQIEASEISSPTRSEWDIPDYVAKPELDGDSDGDGSPEPLSLADELLGGKIGGKPRPGER
jgi:dTMP kinase